LAVYNGHPAFFYQLSPPDTDRLWERDEKPGGEYPRVDYNIDMRYDPERKVSGTLTINVWCTSECKDMPEDIEKVLIDLISGTFYSRFHSDGPDITTCAVWNRSDAFATGTHPRIEDTAEPEMFGVTMLFDLTEFPSQLTTDPDPIQGLNRWTMHFFPDVSVIPDTVFNSVWRPTDEHPAVYWRFIGSDADDRQTYAVNWYNGHFAAHVIADSVDERNRWIKAIVERLQLHGELFLPDRSPMLVKNVAIQHRADPLHEGQIRMTGRYGVLAQHRKETAQIPLNNALFPNIGLEVRYVENEDRTGGPVNKDTNMSFATGLTTSKKGKTATTYTSVELMNAGYKRFGVGPEVVGAALRLHGVTEAGIDETKAMIETFMKREVK